MKKFLFLLLFPMTSWALGIEDNPWAMGPMIAPDDPYKVPTSVVLTFSKTSVHIERTCHFTDSNRLPWHRDLRVSLVAGFKYTANTMSFSKHPRIENIDQTPISAVSCGLEVSFDYTSDYTFENGNLVLNPHDWDRMVLTPVK